MVEFTVAFAGPVLVSARSAKPMTLDVLLVEEIGVELMLEILVVEEITLELTLDVLLVEEIGVELTLDVLLDETELELILELLDEIGQITCVRTLSLMLLEAFLSGVDVVINAVLE